MKSPYLTAFEKYHAREVAVPWTEALDFHLQHGMVISTPKVFAMARPVDPGLVDESHLSLCVHDTPHDRCHHIWVAAGDISELLAEARTHGMVFITYQRREGPLRFANVRELEMRLMKRH